MHSSFQVDSFDSPSLLKDVWIGIRKSYLAVASLGFLFFLLLAAIFVPVFSSHGFNQIQFSLSYHPPSTHFWMGTDDLGRDLFTRIFLGARISLWVAFFSGLINLTLGLFYGIFAGYQGKKTEEVLMRICDIINAIPQILIAIIFVITIGRGLPSILFTICLTGWIDMARIVRNHTLQLKNKPFVLSSLALGASKLHIFLHHLIPNLLGTVLATFTLTVPRAMFLESFLSFLGLGIQPPGASWGVMIGKGIFVMQYHPWVLFFPCLLISLTMLSFNLLGNHLRDVLDPRLRV